MPGKLPPVSVVIPVFNDFENLRHCLDALRHSSVQDFELIVVDDGSVDDSARIATEAGAVVLRSERQMGPAAARNLGARSATAPLLFFLDADVCVHRDTLGHAVNELIAQPEVAAVIGSYDDSPSEERFISQYKNLFHRFVHQTARREAGTFWTGCGAIRRDVFMVMGGFDTSFKRPSIEDIELGVRMVRAGYKIVLCPEMQVQHRKRWTLLGLIRTDLVDRAIPWTKLILKSQRMPDDLNLKQSQRVSAGLTCALIPVLVSAAVLRSLGAVAIAVGMLLAVMALNRDLYRFFAGERGLWFAIRAIPMHLLYYLYSVLGFVIGLAEHIKRAAASWVDGKSVDAA
ncbi:MAG: glycosyltransferase family 2 protein [Bryobacteraceae bacterium]